MKFRSEIDEHGKSYYTPQGTDDDHTRNRKYYDGTYEYLKELGIKEL